MSRNVVVETIGLSKAYRHGKIVYYALNNVSIKVYRGEVVCIAGPSGSGKTTLLNIIGGLDRPTLGRVIVDGIDITNLSESQLAEFRLKRIGFVFQFFNLIPTLTALENVELPLSLAGVPKEKRRKRAYELLEAVGLGAKANYRPLELSGGEQQRVAIARALANNPSIVLADEPTGNLDSKTTIAIMELIRKLNREFNQTFIIATHDPLVMSECSRVLMIRDGRIERELTRDELKKIKALQI